MHQFALRLVVVLYIFTIHNAFAEDDVVQIQGGAIIGVRDSASNLRFWKAIPYAESTGGENRFQKPIIRRSWSPSVLNATEYGAGCFSDHHNTDTCGPKGGIPCSEDCLNLNVFVPLVASLNASAKLPVMFFMYGGSFAEGYDEGPFDMYDGSYIASTRDVIVVTINYRLGPFGFVVTDAINGNMGLMDQRMALEWVQDNIAVFGGDPKNVVIWGESAGAMSVATHLISPKSAGLFSKAIMESTVDILYLEKDKAKLYGAEYCKILNCTSGLLHEKCNVTCLQLTSVDSSIQAWEKAVGNVAIFLEANWGHVEDGLLSFIPTCCDEEVPAQYIPALQAGMVANVPILAGINTDEGATFLFDGVPYLPMFAYEEAVNFLFGNENGKTIINYYSRYGYKDGRDALAVVFTDYWFRCPLNHWFAAVEAKGSPAWSYRYNHVLSAAQIFPEFGLPKVCSTRVCHASELPVVFHRVNIPSINVSLPQLEIDMSDQIVDYWTSFAKTGTPTGKFPWPIWNNQTRENIILQEDMSKENSMELCGMWDAIGYNH